MRRHGVIGRFDGRSSLFIGTFIGTFLLVSGRSHRLHFGCSRQRKRFLPSVMNLHFDTGQKASVKGNAMMLEIQRCQITLVDEDCRFEEDIPTASPQCSEEEIKKALASKTLTPDQCLWLHERGISWEIRLRDFQSGMNHRTSLTIVNWSPCVVDIGRATSRRAAMTATKQVQTAFLWKWSFEAKARWLCVISRMLSHSTFVNVLSRLKGSYHYFVWNLRQPAT